MGKFLMLSDCGDGMGIALRLKVEGHDARIKIFDSAFTSQGKGLVDFADHYTMGQTMIADVTSFGTILEKFRECGVPIFGGGVLADKLEQDRRYAKEVMLEAQIDTPDSLEAKTWDDARKACEKIGEKSGKVVIKPEGELSGVVPSYVASDIEDALAMLQQFEKEHSSDKIELTIQEFVEGVAVSTEGWFNGVDWAEGMFNHTIERKHALVGDLGPSGGCTGNIIWHCDSSDTLVKETLTKLTVLLRKHRYVGLIDINCVVNDNGIYGLEFTPRFGYDSFPTTLHSLIDFDFGSLVDDMSRGVYSGESLNEGFGAGVRLSLPPWPCEKFHHDGGVRIQGLEEKDWQWFYPYGVTREGGELKSSSGVGILASVNGLGDSIGEAFARVYEIVTRLKIPEVQYRTDLTKVCREDYRQLIKYLTGNEGEWIGVDLDGTLATYSKWSEDIGEPVPKMVQRVKRWIAEGKNVKILTARGSLKDGMYEQLIKVHEWVREHIGTPLEVTHEKDPLMIRLYDDRVRQVEANEGVLV